MIVYVIKSPELFAVFPSFWVTTAVLVTSNPAIGEVSITVLSSVVFPSVSSPSSEVSETLPLCPGLLATTLTVLLTNPV